MASERLPVSGVPLQGVELLWLDLHLRSPHVSALGTTTERPVVVARIATGAVDGWGECAALVAPTYTEEYAEGAWAVLRDHLLPLLMAAARSGGSMLPEPAAVRSILEPVRGHSMAKACLEMGVLDTILRSESRSLAELLGTSREQVEAGAVLGLVVSPEETEAMLHRVGELTALGYSRVKLKIAPGADLAVLAALRGAFPTLGIQADANGSYDLREPSHAKALESLDELDLLCVEQPLHPDNLAGHAELALRLRTPVCLDESIWSLARLHEAIASKACDMVCIKSSRLGGVLQALEAHDISRRAGIDLWCGGMLETALGRSANAAVAALPGFVLPGDLSGGERFFEADPFLAGAGPNVAREAGPTVSVHAGPGVGPEPDPVALDLVTTRRHWTPI